MMQTSSEQPPRPRRLRPVRRRNAATMTNAEFLLVTWWDLGKADPGAWDAIAGWCWGAGRLAQTLGMVADSTAFYFANKIASDRAAMDGSL